METTDRYRRSLKRKNYSPHTVKTYMNILSHFTGWLAVPLPEVTRKDIGSYVDYLLRKHLSPKTITCHLQTIRLFFDYLINDEETVVTNPVTKVSIRLPKPLPRHLKDDQVGKFLAAINDVRDRAMFMVMLRCGLRVEEVSRLTIDAIDLPRSRLLVANGKGAKDRVVYLSKDARSSLEAYLKIRMSKLRNLFLVGKGRVKGTPISVRGIQKRIEYYAGLTGIDVSCHSLRHTFATQLLNADADLSSIQDLLGHARITTTQRYCKVSNLKVQRDYYNAIEVVMQRSQGREGSDRREPNVMVLVPSKAEEPSAASEEKKEPAADAPALLKEDPVDDKAVERIGSTMHDGTIQFQKRAAQRQWLYGTHPVTRPRVWRPGSRYAGWRIKLNVGMWKRKRHLSHIPTLRR